MQDTSEGLHIAGWCNELPLDARGDTVAKGADLGSGLQLTLLLVNSGTGRRGGVRVVAPSSARWLRAEASYAYNIGLPPHDDKTRRPLLRLQRSTDSSNGDGHRLSGGPGQLEVLDSAPLPKYGAYHTARVPSVCKVDNVSTNGKFRSVPSNEFCNGSKHSDILSAPTPDSSSCRSS